ncbi:MAG: Gfo/Idh/MocA family protein, partial [Gemmatimonadota bacterium]
MKIGLLGCGRIARFFHLDILANRSPFQLLAVADAAPEARATASEQAPGAALYDDYRALIERADVDSVVVCLPPALHVPAGVAAFQAGKHVYMEKPIARTAAEAAPLIEAWEASGRVGMMGFNYRYDPSFREARDVIRAGRLGEVVAVRSSFTSETRSLPRWKESRESGGGALLDLASHHIDLIRYLLGEEPIRGFASVRSDRVEDDHATFDLFLESGVTVQSFASLSSVHDHRLEVHGRDAFLRVDRFRRPSLSIRARPPT